MKTIYNYETLEKYSLTLAECLRHEAFNMVDILCNSANKENNYSQVAVGVNDFYNSQRLAILNCLEKFDMVKLTDDGVIPLFPNILVLHDEYMVREYCLDNLCYRIYCSANKNVKKSEKHFLEKVKEEIESYPKRILVISDIIMDDESITLPIVGGAPLCLMRKAREALFYTHLDSDDRMFMRMELLDKKK